LADRIVAGACFVTVGLRVAVVRGFFFVDFVDADFFVVATFFVVAEVEGDLLLFAML
jgi:hypothetical protein